MDAVVAFIATGEATKPVEPGERALDDPAEHAKAAAVGRAATAEDRNNAAGGEAITMWLRIVATVALQDVGHVRDPLAAIGWVRSSFFPPRIARTDPLSTTVQR
jgi:hypothetical protein